MKKSIHAQDIVIISHSTDQFILHNFYTPESVEKDREFWKFHYVLFNVMSDILSDDESDAVTAAAATLQAPQITTPQALQAPQLFTAFTKLSHKNWIADQFIQKWLFWNQHLLSLRA